MRLMWKAVDKMRCLRKRSVFPFLGFLITFLLFFNLYLDDGYVLVGLLPYPVGLTWFAFAQYVLVFVLFRRLRKDSWERLLSILPTLKDTSTHSEISPISLGPLM